ncbi:MAG TPA: hypothetical protein VJ553_06240 [Candidatus Paceibacterota bacterium]|nr:hypothetical protein [Candidatus Paceibacterota bacterium]
MRGTSFRLVSASAIAVMSLCLLVSTGLSVRAANSDLTVVGVVYDVGGVPLEDADVVITIVGTPFARYAVTDSDGQYTTPTDFNGTDYIVGDTIRVVASYNSQVTAPNETVIDSDMALYGATQVDVHYTYEIPEFGSLTGTVVAMSAIALVGAALFARRRK